MSDTLPTEDSRAFAGVPDGFDRLWTPYRMAYINGDHKPADSSSEECPFCVAPSRTDEEGLIVISPQRWDQRYCELRCGEQYAQPPRQREHH